MSTRTKRSARQQYTQPTFALALGEDLPQQTAALMREIMMGTPPQVNTTQASKKKQKAVLSLDDLPGPLARQWLISLGILEPLDSHYAFRCGDGENIYGRAAIVREIIPPNTTACGRTAAWIWLGGDFPNLIELLSTSHIRSRIIGRRVQTYSKRVPPTQLSELNRLQLTNPVRTACDLALVTNDKTTGRTTKQLIRDLMDQYSFDTHNCMDILDQCSYLHTAQRAKVVLSDFVRIA